MTQYNPEDFDAADFAYRSPRHNFGNEHQIAIRSPQGEGPDGYDWRIVNTDRKTTRGFINSASLAVTGWMPLSAPDPAVDKPKPVAQLDRIEALLEQITKNTEPTVVQNVVAISAREAATLTRRGTSLRDSFNNLV